jgi:peroxiredoxin
MTASRIRVCFTAFCLFVLLGSRGTPFHAAENATANLGKKIGDFSLRDTKGQRVSLSEFTEKKAIVVVFIGTECPINNSYMPCLAELHKAYADRGVQFLAINANQQDTPARVAEHAKKYGLTFPVLKDNGNLVADEFSAQRTPEAFVLDAEHKIRYEGRIDDQFGVGFQRLRPTHRDLAIALDEILAGKPVSQPTTKVAGCIISRLAKPKSEGTITFSNQVIRILQKNCQECHRPGQIGPMPLLNYDDAVAWSEMLREVVQERRMPPWFADPKYGKFSNDRSLPQTERETLLAWTENGCPKGDDKDLPPPREFTPGWIIGNPDEVFTMKEAYEVPAVAPKEGIPYQNFEVETNFTEDKWVRCAEAKAGAAEVVHHIVVFIVRPGLKFKPMEGNAPLLTGTAPGDMPLILRPGAAKRVSAGSKLIFQMHYTANGKAQKDRSSVGIIFAKEPPKHEVFSVPVANLAIRIPPGVDNYQRESAHTFRNDVHIYGFMPHMHLRGKDILAEAIYADGRKETLLSVPRYNFNWQSVYRLEKPVPMPKGSRIHFIAHFDNSSKNPNNPDPTKEVRWGDQTWEEMLIGWTDVAFDQPPAKTATTKK